VSESGREKRLNVKHYLVQHEPSQTWMAQGLGLHERNKRDGEHELALKLHSCGPHVINFEKHDELGKDPFLALGRPSNYEPLLSDVQRFRIPLLLGMHPGAPRDYISLFKQPFSYWILLINARILCAVTFYIWAYGWLSTGASWIRTLPCILQATLILMELIPEHFLGPISWCTSKYGMACQIFHTACFIHACIFVPALRVENKPFESRLIHLLLSGIVSYLGGIFVQLNMLCSLKKAGIAVPRLAVARMVLWKGLLYTLRLEDCFTDIEVSAVLIRQVRSVHQWKTRDLLWKTGDQMILVIHAATATYIAGSACKARASRMLSALLQLATLQMAVPNSP
jgi:hypothetical protein